MPLQSPDIIGLTDILINLSKEMAVFLAIAYLLTKTPVFKVIISKSFTKRDYLILYVVFTVMSVIGTYFGIPVHGAIANNRVIGAALAGLIGGPALGFSVGLTAGVHRYFIGGFTGFACGLSTTVEGLFAGVVHVYLTRRGKFERIFDPFVAFYTTFVAEVLQMLIILAIARPLTDAVELIKLIALPMILSNSIGTSLIMSIFKDQKYNYDKIGSAYSKKALKIARKILGFLKENLDYDSAAEIAEIIRKETGVAAVAITDRHKVLAFTGIGSDHHVPGMDIASSITKNAIKKNEIIFLDGIENQYRCNVSSDCKLSSVLVVPVSIRDEVIGAIKLYEQKNKYFNKINIALGEGIAELVSNQLIIARYEQQKNLLTQAELKLIQAQINPHFLFNAINTIIAVSRTNAEKARNLLLDLSNFFRKNLKRKEDVSTIREELEHVNSYLRIEKARFQDKLEIITQVDESLLNYKIPIFTIQPIVENAIKHGISKILDRGRVKINIFRNNGNIQIEIEDNGGAYSRPKQSDGLGINIVNNRIKNLMGKDYGIEIKSEPGIKTIATITLPGGGI